MMTDALLIIIGISQIIIIAILIMLLKNLDKADYSKEDATVKDLKAQTESTASDVNTAQHNLPPRT